jgi:hypothetical protein
MRRTTSQFCEFTTTEALVMDVFLCALQLVAPKQPFFFLLVRFRQKVKLKLEIRKRNGFGGKSCHK